MEEIYKFGRTTGEACFSQIMNRVEGFITIHDTTDDDEDIIIHQDIIGTIRAKTVFLYGTHIRTIKGRADSYELERVR